MTIPKLINPVTRVELTRIHAVTEPKDPLKVFGFKGIKNLTENDIKKRYHKIVLLIHPDKQQQQIELLTKDQNKNQNKNQKENQQKTDKTPKMEMPDEVPMKWLAAAKLQLLDLVQNNTTQPDGATQPAGHRAAEEPQR